MEFNQLLEKKVAEIERIIFSYLPKATGDQKTLFEAMHYTMSAGGKRIRPLLMSETYQLFGGTDSFIEPFMAAIEMIHTYSLIHDDLPAMDNDDTRRGRKTAHIVYGEAMAILAGDGLLNYAFEVATNAFDITNAKEDNLKVIKAMKILAKKPGIYGMIGGQALDIELTGKPLNARQIDCTYALKTGALLEASMMIGAVLGGADEHAVSVIEEIAHLIGMTFQIQDDILDLTGDSEEIGKPAHSDEKNEKTTYVILHGIEKAKEDACAFSKEAMEKLKGFGCEEESFLYTLITSLMNRKK